jgi:hypothetical protein
MAGPKQIRPMATSAPASYADDHWVRQEFRKGDKIAYKNKRTGRIEWVNETLSVWLTRQHMGAAIEIVEAVLNDPPKAEGSGPFNAMRAARSLSLRRAVATLRGDDPVEEVW